MNIDRRPKAQIGDRTRDAHGYIRVKVSADHPFADRGWLKEHRAVAEKALGKFLARRYPVHHHNTDKEDNANTNLVICDSNGYHKLIHKRTAVLKQGGDPNQPKICSLCDRLLQKESFHRSNLNSDGFRSDCKQCRILKPLGLYK